MGFIGLYKLIHKVEATLYFICPTDFLETVINATFSGDNYFLTSLGNSINLEENHVAEICELIEKRSIASISFILSDDNKFIQNTLNSQKACCPFKMKRPPWKDVKKRNESTRPFFCPNSCTYPAIANYLDSRIKELDQVLSKNYGVSKRIDAKLYVRQKNTFVDLDLGLRSKILSNLN